MLSVQVRDDARFLLQALQEAAPLVEVVRSFAEAQKKVNEAVLTFTEGQEKHLHAAGEVHRIFASCTQYLSGKSLRNVFLSSRRLTEALHAYEDSIGATEIVGLIHRFDEILDSLGTSHSIWDGALILSAADELLTRLSAMQSDLTDLVSKLDPGFVAYDEDVVHISLVGQYSLREIGDKLIALDDICQVMSSVLLQFQIYAAYRVRKIETGSLSIEVVAEKIGILALKRVLVGGIDFIHRNYTNEGRLRHGVPATTAALKDAMKLRNALAKEGLNVDGIDDALASRTEQLVERIGVLSGFDREVRVNGQQHARTDEQPYIGNSYALPNAQPASRLGHDQGSDSE